MRTTRNSFVVIPALLAVAVSWNAARLNAQEEAPAAPAEPTEAAQPAETTPPATPPVSAEQAPAANTPAETPPPATPPASVEQAPAANAPAEETQPATPAAADTPAETAQPDRGDRPPGEHPRGPRPNGSSRYGGRDGSNGERPSTPEAETPPEPNSESPSDEEAAPQPPPEPIELQRYKPETSFSRLLIPSVAARMQLTDEQRAEVQRLVNERSQKLAAAPGDQWMSLIEANEQQLKAVLRPDQLDDWPPSDEPRIRINFKFVLWEDVLQWIAQQADLSLVLDAPPPGSFNYADEREYTVSGAIDVINGILLTKGYTLVRRDRMLMLFDLRKGLPRDLLPTVERDELEDRGKFEYVRVLFKIGKRDAGAVESAIRPLLGPYNNVTSIPAQQSMLITDTAGVLRPIGRIIDSIPERQDVNPLASKVKEYEEKQKKLEQQLKEYERKLESRERPVTEFYDVQFADVDTVVKTIERLHSSANVTRDPKTDRLVVHATPSQQDSIKKIIDTLDADTSTNEAPHLVGYSLESLKSLDEVATKAMVAQMLTATFQSLAPNAKIVVDPSTKKLMALASPKEHEILSKSVEQLTGEASAASIAAGGSERIADVYALKSDVPKTIDDMIDELAPNADVTVDIASDRILVVASPEDHQKIQTLVDRLDETAEGADADEEQTLVSYPVTTMQRRRFMSLYSSLYHMPHLLGMRYVADDRDNIVAIWATPKQHVRIAAIMDELKSTTLRGDGDEAPELKVYPLTTLTATAAEEVVEELVPEARVLRNNETNSLIAVATTAEHEAIGRALEQLQTDAPGGSNAPSVKFYDAEPEKMAEIVTALERLVPSALVTQDVENRRLVVIARSAEHDEVAKTIDTFAAAASAKPSLRYHAIAAELPSEVMTLIAERAPGAKITVDSPNRRLMVVATDEDHATIAELIESAEADGGAEKEIAIYPIEGGVSDTLLDLLKKTVPNAEIQVDDLKDRLIVVASTADQAEIKKTIDELAVQLPADEKRELKVYPITSTQRTRFDAVRDTLRQDIGEFDVINDGREGELSVWAGPSQHAVIAATLKELSQTANVDAGSRLLIHQLKSADADTLIGMLEELYPDARIEHEPNTNRLFLWSQPEQLEKIRATLLAVDAEADPDQARRFAAYELKSWYGYGYDSNGVYRAYNVMSDLRTLAPNARITVDRETRTLMVWGTAEEQEAIAAAVKDLLDSGSKDVSIQVYPITKTDLTMVYSMLARRFANANVTYDRTESRIVVEASAEDHAEIKAIMEQLEPLAPGPNDPTLHFYALDVKPSPLLVSGLKTLVPDADITEDAAAKRLMVIASPREHEVIAANLDDLQDALPGAYERRLVVYPVDARQRGRFEAFLEAAEPDLEEIRIVADDTNGAMSVWASPDEHAMVGEVLAQLKQDVANGAAHQLRGFSLTTVEPKAAAEVLEEMFPGVRFIDDDQTNRLLVYAAPDMLTKIEEAVKQLDAEPADANKPRFESFSVPGMHETSSSSRYLSLMSLRENLESLAPHAKIMIASDYRHIIVWGTAAELDLLRAALEKLSSPENAPTVKTYPVLDVDYRSVYYMFARLTPSAIISFDYQGGRMVVFATPNDHDVIGKTVEQINAGGPAPNAHVLRVYDMKETPTNMIIEGLEDIAPRAEIEVDRNERELIVIANERDQERLKEAIDALNASISDETELFFESYEINGLYTQSSNARYLSLDMLRDSLEVVVPDARVVLDGEFSKLVAFGTRAELDQIRKALEGLGRLDSPETAPRVEVYDVEGVDSESLLSMLEDLVDKAELSYEESTGRLIALARPEDHVVIAEVTEKLSKAQTSDDSRLIAYPVPAADADTLAEMLAELHPTARIEKDARGRRLLIWAKPEEHASIGDALEEVNGDAPLAMEEKFVAYPIEDVSPEAAEAIIEKLVPGAEPIIDDAAKTIIVYGTDDEQQVVAEAFAKLVTADEDKKPTLVVYPCGEADPEEIADIVRTMLDKEDEDSSPYSRYSSYYSRYSRYGYGMGDSARTVRADGKTRTVAVLATTEQHKRIQNAIQAMAAASVNMTEKRVKKYNLIDITASTAMRLLESDIPSAEMSVGDTYELIVHGTDADHKKVQKFVDYITEEGPGESRYQVKTYHLKRGSAEMAANTIRHMVDGAYSSPGNQPNQLIVWGRGFHHDRVQRIIDEFEKETPPEQTPVFETYPLKHITPETAERMLEMVMPGIWVNDDRGSNALIVWAPPSDQERVRATLLQIDTEKLEQEADRPQVYVLENMSERQMYYAFRLLYRAVPGAVLSQGSDESQIIAWANPKEHEKLADLVRELTVPKPEWTPTMKVYKLDRVDAPTAITILEEAAPTAELTVGADVSELIAWARPSDHEKIEKAIAEMDAAEPSENAPVMESYELTTGDVLSATTMIGQIAPDAAVTPGTDAKHLIVWARPTEHAKIKESLQKLNDAAPEPTLNIYRLEKMNLLMAVAAARGTAPDALVLPGNDSSQLIVWARPDDHAKIAKMIETTEAQLKPETAIRFESYMLQRIDRGVAMQYLRMADASLKIIPGVEPHELVVWGRPSDHETVAGILAKVDVEPDPATAATTVRYDLSDLGMRQTYYILSFLRQIVPGAEMTLSVVDPSQLIVNARPKDHEVLRDLIDELTKKDPESTPIMEVYTLTAMDAASAMVMLRPVAPLAEITPGADPSQMIVWARPREHAEIKKAIEAVSGVATAENAAKMETYALKGVSYLTATDMLARLAPTAVFATGSNPQQLVVWARPDEHAKILDALDRMSDKGPTDSIPTMKTYTIKSTTAILATPLLQQVAPQAQFGYSSDPHQLLIWAIPSDHEAIGQAVESIETPKPEEATRTVKVYSFETAGAVNAQTILQQALPQAEFTIGTDPSKLIVWAYPDDHAVIDKALQEIEADSWVQGNRVMSTYPMRAEDTQALMQLLDPVLQQNAQFIHDPAREVLIVWANEKHHAAIKHTVDEYLKTLPEAVEPEARVYRFEHAHPYTALSSIPRIAPDAQVSYDYLTRALVITALPEEHRKIQQLVDEVDREEQDTSRSVKVHRVLSADIRDVYLIARGLYMQQDPQFVMTLDANNRALIVLGTPAQHEKIEGLIEQIEEGALGDEKATMALYSLKHIDAYSAFQILGDVLETRGVEIDMTLDRYSNQLVAIARPEHHALIAETLDTLRTPAREVEVFQLDEVDPTSAQLAVSGLFEDESYLSQPSVNIDEYSNQMFVTGTQEQIDKIRELLIEMGERSLRSEPGGYGGRLRTIKIEGDTTELIQRLKESWAETAANRLEIIREADVTSPSKQPSDSPPDEPDRPKDDTTSAAPKLEGASANPKSSVVTATRTAATEPRSIDPIATNDGALGPQGDPGEQGPAEDVGVATVDAPPEATAEKFVEPETIPGAPVTLLVAEDGTLTMVSEDLEALDMLETLLKELTSRAAFEGRDYAVFRVEHVPAAQVLQSLQIVLRERMTTGQASPRPTTSSSAFGSRRIGSIVVTADERLNTIFVQGTKTDRKEVEGLIKMLDVEQVPGMDMLQPTLIAVENTQAGRLYQLVLQVFQTKLIATQMPGGQTARIGVDSLTNSLVVVAPDGLTEEIRQFVEKLDERVATDPAEELHVIQLQKANSLRMHQALQSILRMSNYPSASGYVAPTYGPSPGYGVPTTNTNFNRGVRVNGR